MRLDCRSVRTSPGRWARALAWITGFFAPVMTPAVLGGGLRDLVLVAVWGLLATTAGTVIARSRQRRNTTIAVEPESIEDGFEAHSKRRLLKTKPRSSAP